MKLTKMNVTKEFAEILGLLCAEGSHIVSFSSYYTVEHGRKTFRKNKGSERIEFYNKDEKLLFHYQSLLNKEFGYQSKVTKHGKINIGKRSIIREIIRHTELGHMRWRIPNSVISSDRIVKIAFLRGFFDGDGTVISSVRMFSTNKKGIDQLSFLLSELEFEHTMRGPVIKPNRKPHYVLRIRSKDQIKFLKEINPISKLPKLR